MNYTSMKCEKDTISKNYFSPRGYNESTVHLDSPKLYSAILTILENYLVSIFHYASQ